MQVSQVLFRAAGFAALFVALTVTSAFAQPGGGGARPPQQTPKQAAPIDVTGYWTAVVTEDWMYRMVTPPKGKYVGVPLNPAGRRAADSWDPAKDEAAGQACKAYGAPAVMRIPGRIHITWQDDRTLKVETEAGQQTRTFSFGAAAAPGTPSLQGVSLASWEQAAVKRGDPKAGDLKVTTGSLRPGYLRKNGVPYSANTQVTEYYDSHTGPDGDVWLIVTTEVRDPENLTQPFVTSSHFRKLSDAQGAKDWKPEACTAK